jgi:large subunit ribosomal protein L10
MAITKNKKKEILDKLKSVIDKKSVVFLNFHGLPVTESSEIRKELRGKDVSYFVAKKTLIKKAFEESKVDGQMPQLDGEVAIVYGDDETTSPREIFAYQKKFSGKVNMLGGVFDNKFLNKSEIEEIALIPSLHVLRGMFVNVINSPIQGFAMAIKAIADKKA